MVLVGHGAAASDTPRALVSRLKALEGERRARRSPMTDEERELDAKIRHWPRTATTDRYQAGMEAIAARLRARVARVVVAYNEFCAPSLEQAVEQLVAGGERHVTVVTTMLTPGGVHAEEEIPESIEALRLAHPGVRIDYAWPFDLEAVAHLFANAAEGAARATS